MRWGTPVAALCALFFASGIACAQDQAASPPAQQNAASPPQPSAPPAPQPDAVPPTAQPDAAPPTATREPVPPTAQPSAPSPLQDAIRVAVSPHATLMISNGWYACDADANKLLGGVQLPPGLGLKMCDLRGPGMMSFKFINPNLAQLMFVLVLDVKDATVTPHYFEALPPQDLKTHIDELCEKVRGSQQMTDYSCNLGLGTVAGRRSLVGNVAGTRPDNQMIIHMRFAAIPFDGDVFVLIIADVNSNQAKTSPLVDAMVDLIIVN